MLKVFCYMIKLSCIMADLIDIFFRFETDNGKLRLITRDRYVYIIYGRFFVSFTLLDN